MKLFPIIPIWIMLVICIILIIITIKYNKKDINSIISIALLFVINLRIMIPSEKSQIMTNNLDVLFVIDNTISMIAEDYDDTNTRLDAVKKDCKYIIEELNGARFSLITFNNTARIIIPYTNDINMTIEAIDIMEPIEEFYANGSSLNTPLDLMISNLKSIRDKDDTIKILFFISDGEITDESSLKSFKNISKYIDNGAVLGYGTSKGGYMKFKSKYFEEEYYIMDYSLDVYDKAISKIDENNLRAIAKDMNIEYINMEKQSNINNKLKEIKGLINNSIMSSNKNTYTDTYYFLAIPLLILLIIEFNKFRRKNI